MRKITVILFAALFFAGCLEEDRGYCPPTNVRFDFSYTFNMESTDLFARDFGSVGVWVFDAGGALFDEFRASAEDVARGYMDVDVTAGRYSFVAWGTSGDVLEEGGYHVAGESLEEFLLHLADPSAFDDLYHAIARDVWVSDTESRTVPMAFTRHTNFVRLRVRKGMESVPTRAGEAPLDIHVTGRKGIYAHDGAIHPATPEHRYDATGHRVNNADLHADLHLQRFDVGFHAENPVLLNIEQGGTPLIRPLDLVALLRMNPAYATQAALDRASEFNIDIWLKAETDVVISVDGWVVQHIGAEIGAF
jgi:hypothetical protein